MYQRPSNLTTSDEKSASTTLEFRVHSIPELELFPVAEWNKNERQE